MPDVEPLYAPVRLRLLSTVPPVGKDCYDVNATVSEVSTLAIRSFELCLHMGLCKPP